MGKHSVYELARLMEDFVRRTGVEITAKGIDLGGVVPIDYPEKIREIAGGEHRFIFKDSSYYALEDVAGEYHVDSVDSFKLKYGNVVDTADFVFIDIRLLESSDKMEINYGSISDASEYILYDCLLKETGETISVQNTNINDNVIYELK